MKFKTFQFNSATVSISYTFYFLKLRKFDLQLFGSMFIFCTAKGNDSVM